MNQEPIYVGIDVSKSRLDVGVRPGGDGWSMAYDEAGIRDLASSCSPWDQPQWCWKPPEDWRCPWWPR